MATCVFQILQIGSAGPEQTKVLQHALGLKEDGKFGPVTKNAVMAKQRILGLVIDGIAGEITCKSLGIWCSNPVPNNKSSFHLMVEDHVGFKYNTFNEFFNGMSSKGYLYYNNDIYPQGQALDRLKANSGLNCADVSQIGYAVAKDLGLEVHYGHIKCQQGGHIVLILGSIKNGTVYDLAKKISKTSGPTTPGDYWCKGTGYFVSYDDPWLMLDDGIT